jgi:superfamily II DNA helicase RecQ
MWQIDSLLAFNQPIQPVADMVAPEDKARQALTIFTKNPNARFRSEFQHKWLTELFKEKLVDLLVVSRTGGGKSLAFTLPPLVFFVKELSLSNHSGHSLTRR